MLISTCGDSQATKSVGSPPTTFLLRPQHAHEPHAQLLFKMDPDGGMALLPNEYATKHLKQEVETFITRCAARVCESALRQENCMCRVIPIRSTLHNPCVATRFKSIPAFTANLTMDMFQKQTQS